MSVFSPNREDLPQGLKKLTPAVAYNASGMLSLEEYTVTHYGCLPTDIKFIYEYSGTDMPTSACGVELQNGCCMVVYPASFSTPEVAWCQIRVLPVASFTEMLRYLS